jgi:hypothetical protein
LGQSVRKNGRRAIAALRTKCRQLFHTVAKGHQIQNGAKPLSPEIPIKTAYIHMFPLPFHKSLDGRHQVRKKLAFID